MDNVACFAFCSMQKQPITTLGELLFCEGLGSWVILFLFNFIFFKCSNSYFIIQILFGRIFFLAALNTPLCFSGALRKCE